MSGLMIPIMRFSSGGRSDVHKGRNVRCLKTAFSQAGMSALGFEILKSGNDGGFI